MFEVGDHIKFMEPLDHDFTYGIIRETGKGGALIEVTSFPYEGKGKMVKIGYKYLYLMRGGKRFGSRIHKNNK